jgi:exodeoxyribonuclease-3
MTKIISWNINGLKRIHDKGFNDLVKNERPDIICLQETHATEDEVREQAQSFEGYHYASSPAVKLNTRLVCGVATFSREIPTTVKETFKSQDSDYPGRILINEFHDFVLLNCYFPTGTGKPEEKEAQNQLLKRAFYRDCYSALNDILQSGKEIVLCGDFNTAYDDRDYWGAFQKKKTPGFLPEDREDIKRLFSLGMIDAFREKNKEGDRYTWWYNRELYDKKQGWRIDYFLVSPNLKFRIRSCTHLEDLVKNDHCPIILDLGDHC